MQYLDGCDYEIYSVRLDDSFTGVVMSDLALKAYCELQVIAFAVEITPLSKSCASRTSHGGVVWFVVGAVAVAVWNDFATTHPLLY